MGFSLRAKGLVVWLVVIWGLTFGVRLINLTSIPPVISHDEIYYVLQAKTLALSGSDPTGQWRPWHLRPAHPLFAELPGLVMMPAALLFPDQPLIAARLTAVFLGSLIPFLLAGITFQLFKERRLSWLVLGLAIFNPWLWQFSRLGFDALLSIFFYLLGLWLFLSGKKWALWLSLPILILGFFQYQGLKLVFPIMIGASFVYSSYQSWFNSSSSGVFLKKNWSQLVWLTVLWAVFGLYLARLFFAATDNRVNDLIFFADDQLAAEVNYQRQVGLLSPGQKIFINKFTVMGYEIAKKFLATFNVHELFLNLDSRRNPFGVWSHGLFYLLDLPLIVLGLMRAGLKRKWRAPLSLLLLFVLVGALPNSLQTQDSWIALRSSFSFVWLIVLAALGLDLVWSKLSWRWLVLGLYGWAVLNYFYIYFYRYPIYSTTGPYFAERVMSSYIARNGDRPVLVLADESQFVFSEILVFNNLLNSSSVTTAQSSFRNENFRLGDLQVKTDCFNPQVLEAGTIAVVSASVQPCVGQIWPDSGWISIASILDNGQHFRIYGDQLCGGYGLNRFNVLNTNLLGVEVLSNEQFCRIFFVQP